MIVPQHRTVHFTEVEDGDGGGDDDGLTDLEAVDPSQDVDGVGAEHGQHSHEHVVKDPKVYRLSAQP